MPVTAVDPGKFVEPRLHVATGTIERFAELLRARPQGILRLQDELSALFLNMRRYSGGQDNEFWLEAWNGRPYTVEHMSRQLSVDHLLIGVVGGLQPDKVNSSFSGDHDGMYARFLFSWPSEPPFRDLTDETAEVEPEIVNALTRIDKLGQSVEGVLGVKDVPLSNEARTRFAQFRQFAHRFKQGFEGRERDWVAKMPAHVLRLAGTLCYLDWAFRGGDEPAEIGVRFMEAAVRLVRDYFWPHTRAALRQIGVNKRHTNARRTLNWIRSNGKTEVSREDIRRDALGQSLDAKETDALLESLERSGWLKKATTKHGPGGGKPTVRWTVNPALWLTAETAETAQTS
jgi:hypothetical protein